MRRLVPILLALCLLCACAERVYPTDDAYHAASDCQWALAASSAVTRFAQAGDVLYSLIGNHLYATSTETWVTVAVCARPDCDHDRDDPMKEASDCDAFFPNPTGVFAADGAVWVLHDASHYTNKTHTIVYERALTRLDPEKGTRRRVLSYPRSVEFAACIHRGQFYCARAAFDENGGGSVGIYRYSLANPSREPDLLLQLEPRPGGGGGQVSSTVAALFAWGNHLYVAAADEGYHRTWSGIDLRSGEVQCLPAPAGAEAADSLLILNGGLLVAGRAAGAYDSGLAQRLDPAGKPVSAAEPFPYVDAIADDAHLYARAAQALPDGVVPDLTLYILNGSLAAEDTLAAPAARDGRAPVFFDPIPLEGDWVLLETMYDDGTFVLSRFPKAQIGSGGIESVPFLTHRHGGIQE